MTTSTSHVSDINLVGNRDNEIVRDLGIRAGDFSCWSQGNSPEELNLSYNLYKKQQPPKRGKYFVTYKKCAPSFFFLTLD